MMNKIRGYLFLSYMQNNSENYHLNETEVSPCIRRLKSMRCMVQSAQIANLSSDVWIFGKSNSSGIGDLGGRIRPSGVLWRPL